MGDSRLNHLGALLESKNRTVRRESAHALGNYSLCDEKVVGVLFKYLTSPSWDCRVASGEAVIAILNRTQYTSASKENPEDILSELCSLNLLDILRNYRPLLSVDSNSIGSVDKSLSFRQQRQIIDQHLDLQPATGLSSDKFISDKEVLPSDLKTDVSEGTEEKLTIKEEVVDDALVDEKKALSSFTNRLISSLADQKWHVRHGISIALARIIASAYYRLPFHFIDICTLRLLQVLVLDQFNDFVSGRSATAPVRESCAQVIGHLLNNSDDHRRQLILHFVHQLINLKDEKLWHCRQSGLLVLKYYFAIATNSSEFDSSFKLVLSCLDDSVDDVVSSAVSTLSSVLAGRLGNLENNSYVLEVMDNIWRLLHVEASKEQLRSGLDGLAVDLMSIIESWLTAYGTTFLKRDQVMLLVGIMDAAYHTRTVKIVRLLSMSLERGGTILSGEDLCAILTAFYRVMLFSPPSEEMKILEHIYLVSYRLLMCYREVLISDENIASRIGLWINCLMFDHRNPLIDTIKFKVSGDVNNEGCAKEPERMCSEEMRFFADRQKDDEYINRKILAAKFLALIIHPLILSGKQLNGQSFGVSIELLFIPCLSGNSLYHALGASLVLNEMGALWRENSSKDSSISVSERPMSIISHCDLYLRSASSPRTYEEHVSSMTQLTQDCNEFINYCTARGVNSETLQLGDAFSVEDLSKTAYDLCRPLLKTEKQRDSLDSRFNMLSDFISYTKFAVRNNTTRVLCFLASALFNYGVLPEKLTPLIRPLVDCMQGEENSTVAAEVFKNTIPLLVNYSWMRQPRPYIKVLARAVEMFPSCPIRVPKAAEGPDESRIISLDRRDSEQLSFGFSSKNSELFLLVCSTIPLDRIPEFASYFALDDCDDENTLVCRLSLHDILWSRVGSRLSPNSAQKIIVLLSSDNPALRFAGAKSVATFCSSQLGPTISLLFETLSKMICNMDNNSERRGAVEAFYRISLLGSALTGVVSLLAPAIYPRLADKLPEVRDAAADAFRNFVPLLTLETKLPDVAGLSDALMAKRAADADFIHVLRSPSSLSLIENVQGLCSDVQLRHYQKEGITWLRFLRRFGLNGILADDMGLGKTLQTLCAIVLSLEQDSLNSCISLIVCPRTLVDHWCNEWKRYFPDRKRAKKADGSKTSFANTELIVTAYDDLKTIGALQKQTWNYIVLDEGHVMRNPNTTIWKVASELKATSRLILSGTPVQNSPADLWALFTWLMPGYLGDQKQFRSQYLKKILRCRSNKATEKDIEAGSQCINRLHDFILPFVMRRMKSEVLKELPDKNVQDYGCELSPLQKVIYKFVVDRCTTNRNQLDAGGISPLHVLITLRKLVDHPKLILDVLEKANAPAELLQTAANSSSGKLQTLGQLLNECGIGCENEECAETDSEIVSTDSAVLQMPHRALIFCQWKVSVQLVSDALTNGEFGCPISHLILDSSVPPSDRQSVVDRFNADHSIDVLVLSTHIGGVGLNLTGADVVIFLDHDWNPMKDLQAIDRAHRLGQTRKVNVYRLITQGTIEEKVMSLHRFKVNTADALIGADNRSLQSMATEELMGMFDLDSSAPEVSASPAPKKRKGASAEMTIDEQWNLADLWDESQYEEQFDVKHFIKQTASSSE